LPPALAGGKLKDLSTIQLPPALAGGKKEYNFKEALAEI